MSDADWRDRPSSYAESAVKGLSALLVAGLAFYLITNKGSDEGSNAGRKSRLSSARGASARSDLHKDTTVDGEVLYGEVLDPAEVQQTKLAASSNYSSQNSRNVHFEDPSTGSLQMENLALPQSPLLEHSHISRKTPPPPSAQINQHARLQAIHIQRATKDIHQVNLQLAPSVDQPADGSFGSSRGAKRSFRSQRSP